MVSSTQQTTRIRRRKQATNGKVNKAQRRLSPTPAFPIHLDAPAAAAATAKAEPAKKPQAEKKPEAAATPAKKEAAPKAAPAKK